MSINRKVNNERIPYPEKYIRYIKARFENLIERKKEFYKKNPHRQNRTKVYEIFKPKP